MSKRPKKPDLNQLAKFIVDEATDETPPEDIDEKKKPPLNQGGLVEKGWQSKIRKTNARRTIKNCEKAANARWNGRSKIIKTKHKAVY